MSTEKQKTYNKKWEEENREYSNFLKARNNARSYVRTKLEDITDFVDIVGHVIRKARKLNVDIDEVFRIAKETVDKENKKG